MLHSSLFIPYQNRVQLSCQAQIDAVNLEAVSKFYNFKRVASCQQTHSDEIFIADKNYIFDNQADAIITKEKGLPLLIKTADCLSVMLFSPKQKVIANIHAGWRGQSLGIISKTIQKLKEAFDCQSQDLIAITTPSLGKCCAQFSNPYQELPTHLHDFIIEKQGGYFVDLKLACQQELLDNGLLIENVEISSICTQCASPQWYSYRADGTKKRNVNLIWLV